MDGRITVKMTFPMPASRLLPLVFLLFGTVLFAQPNNQYTSAADSDAEAVALLKSIRDRYDAYKTIVADFQLDINLPGAQVESQRGKVQRSGERVRFRLGDQEGIVNQEAAYLIQHGNKEVLINNLPEPGEQTGVLTPQTLFNFYEGDNFIVALQNKEVFEGRLLQAIELKPVDSDNSDFTKLRLLVDPEAKSLANVKAFARDGSRFTFTLGEVTGNATLGDKVFVFDKAEFPGYYVEDLRY